MTKISLLKLRNSLNIYFFYIQKHFDKLIEIKKVIRKDIHFL